jgi:hypothetical protein
VAAAVAATVVVVAAAMVAAGPATAAAITTDRCADEMRNPAERRASMPAPRDAHDCRNSSVDANAQSHSFGSMQA